MSHLRGRLCAASGRLLPAPISALRSVAGVTQTFQARSSSSFGLGLTCVPWGGWRSLPSKRQVSDSIQERAFFHFRWTLNRDILRFQTTTALQHGLTGLYLVETRTAWDTLRLSFLQARDCARKPDCLAHIATTNAPLYAGAVRGGTIDIM